MPDQRPNLAGAVGKTSPFTSLRQEAYLNLMRTQAIASGPFDRLFKAHGISQPLYNILRILRGHERQDLDAGAEHRGLPVLRIGQEMVTREPDMTRLINRLEHAGLAVRCRCEHDRRVVYVRITEAGRALLDRMQPATAALHDEQFSALSNEELAILSDLLFRATAGDSSCTGK